GRDRRERIRGSEDEQQRSECEEPFHFDEEDAAAEYTVRPATIVRTIDVRGISAGGAFMISRERTTKSASLPASIEPRSCSANAAYAASRVNARSASSRDRRSAGAQPPGGT